MYGSAGTARSASCACEVRSYAVSRAGLVDDV